MGGLLFGAAIFAAAGGGNNADSILGNMHGLIAGAFSSCKIISYAAESDSVDSSQITKIEYSDLRELIKAGNFSYLQSHDSQNRQSAPYEKMHETLKEEYNYLKKMADSYKNDGDTEMQALYENNAKKYPHFHGAGAVYDQPNEFRKSGEDHGGSGGYPGGIGTEPDELLQTRWQPMWRRWKKMWRRRRVPTTRR